MLETIYLENVSVLIEVLECVTSKWFTMYFVYIPYVSSIFDIESKRNRNHGIFMVICN